MSSMHSVWEILPGFRRRRLLALLPALALAFPEAMAAGSAPRAGFAMHARTGAPLYERNADQKIHPASLTKMMTLYLAFEDLQAGRVSLERRLYVSHRAVRMGRRGANVGLRAGNRLSLRYLIQASAVRSANDAAIVLAEALEGSEKAFARRMTRKARSLGMTRTRFQNATGFTDAQQYSTARDLAILAQALYRDFPGYSKVFSQRFLKVRGRRYRSTNRLLWSYKGMDGLKTGTTAASGASYVGTARRNGQRVIAVVTGEKASTRFREGRRLLDIGFARIDALPVAMASAPPVSPQARGARLASPASAPPKSPAARYASAAPAPLVSRPPPTPPAALRAGAKSRTPRILLAGLAPPAPRARRAPPAPKRPQKWSIQVGAFSSRPEAIASLRGVYQTTPDALRRSYRSVTPVRKGERTLYRARFTGLSESGARDTCRTLQTHQWACVAISPKRRW